jgi:lysine 6-dehydrogenase
VTYRYVVLGAGRQGTAAAYDMARFGDAVRVTLADVEPTVAQAAAQRVNALLARDVALRQARDGQWPQAVATGVGLDVSDSEALRRLLAECDVCLSAVPYAYNLGITRAAIDASAGMCDLGGNTDVVYRQLELDAEARGAGVSVVPDCGMGPGMTTTLATYAMELLDEPRAVYIWDGGLPQNPQPPWHYRLTFHIEGLTNEYDGDALYLRDGELTRVPCFSELEEVDIPPLGRLEAFVTAGGASTPVRTFAGELDVYQNKTLRYPGHCAQFKAFRDLGLFSREPVSVRDQEVVPRDLYHTLLDPQIVPARSQGQADMRDVCVIHVKAVGGKDGQPARAVVDLLDYYDEGTGFTAMERCTGWHAAIMAEMIARGEVRPGVVPLELAVPGSNFVAQARQRGFQITHQIRLR